MEQKNRWEVFRLRPDCMETPILEALLEKGNTDSYIWVDEYHINHLGHDEPSKTYIHEIAPHTKWAHDLKWSDI